MKNIGRFLTIFVLLSVPAFAENRAFTIFAGGSFPGSISLSRVTSGVTETFTNPQNSATFGIRYGRGRVWGHEETFAYTNNFLNENSQSIILNGNLLVQAPLPVLKPYGTAGMGSVMTWGSGLTDIGNKFAVNYGGGLKVTPGGPVGIRFDARVYSIFSVQDQTLNIGEVTVGILFSF